MPVAASRAPCMLPENSLFQERQWIHQPPGALQRSLLPVVQFQRVGKTAQLPSPLRLCLDGPTFTHACVVKRVQASARLLLSCCAADGTLEEMQFDVWWQDLAPDAAAMGLLRIMNALWARARVQVCGMPVLARTYLVEPLGQGASLVEVIPHSVTLGDLKRTFRKGDVSKRVADHLGEDTVKMARLAASTAAFLASNYLLGVVAGNGDNMMLTVEGVLFRVDFRHLFSHSSIGMPCPVVWLPLAVTTALDSRWPDVQEAAMSAFRAARAMFSPAPPLLREMFTPWFRVQAALLKIECLLALPVERYSLGLTEQDFFEALQAADSTLGKKLSTFLHDNLGLRRRQKSTGSIKPGRCSPPRIDSFPHDFELIAADIGSLTWAIEADAKNWRLAFCMLACLCQDQETSMRVLDCFLWDHLVLAARSDSAALKVSVLEAIVSLARHSGRDVQACLAAARSSPLHAESLRAIAARFREHGADLLGPTCSADLALSGDHVALKLGALSAVARMAAAAGSGSGRGELPPDPWQAAEVVRCIAVHVIMSLMRSEDPRMRALLEELSAHMAGADVAVAARGLSEEERFGLVRSLERFAKDAAVRPGLCEWAQACLATMAKDSDPDMSRVAVCAIACAVHDEDPRVQRWARSFLILAARDQDNPRRSAPVFALVRMAQVGEPPSADPQSPSAGCDPPAKEAGGTNSAFAVVRDRAAVSRLGSCSRLDSSNPRTEPPPTAWPSPWPSPVRRKDPFMEGAALGAPVPF